MSRAFRTEPPIPHDDLLAALPAMGLKTSIEAEDGRPIQYVYRGEESLVVRPSPSGHAELAEVEGYPAPGLLETIAGHFGVEMVEV